MAFSPDRHIPAARDVRAANDTAAEIYVAGFVARCRFMRRAGQRELDDPGLHGLLGASNDPRIRLLVTDDRAYDELAALLPDTHAGMISVFAGAERCAGLIARAPARVDAGRGECDDLP